MTRHKPTDRRECVTRHVDVQFDGGNAHRLLMTCGLRDDGRVCEIFCASFKAGTGLNVLVMDACVMASLIIQYGHSASELADTLAKGPSLIGSLLQAAVEVEKEEVKRVEEAKEREGIVGKEADDTTVQAGLDETGLVPLDEGGGADGHA